MEVDVKPTLLHQPKKERAPTSSVHRVLLLKSSMKLDERGCVATTEDCDPINLIRIGLLCFIYPPPSGWSSWLPMCADAGFRLLIPLLACELMITLYRWMEIGQRLSPLQFQPPLTQKPGPIQSPMTRNTCKHTSSGALYLIECHRGDTHTHTLTHTLTHTHTYTPSGRKQK